jgi:hypothetical protein
MKEITSNIDIKIKYYVRLFVFVYNPKFSCEYLTEVNTCTVHLTLWKSEFGDVCYLLWKSSVRLTADQEHSLCALYVYCILSTSLILGHIPEHHTHINYTSVCGQYPTGTLCYESAITTNLHTTIHLHIIIIPT